MYMEKYWITEQRHRSHFPFVALVSMKLSSMSHTNNFFFFQVFCYKYSSFLLELIIILVSIKYVIS